MISLINGRQSSTVAVDDRGLAFGDGLFETVLIRQGEPVWLEEHLQRLQAGCRRLSLTCDPPLIREELNRLLDKSPSSTHAAVKVILTRRSEGRRGYRPQTSDCNRLLMYQPITVSRKHWDDGVTTQFCQMRLGRNPALAGMKHLGRLEQVLASAELEGTDHVEGLMLDDSGAVIEGTMSNLFIVVDRQLLTPCLDDCGVAGIVRERVMDWCNEQSIPCTVQRLSPEDVYRAQELFITNSLIGIVPVVAAGGHRAAPGAITRAVQKAFERFWYD